MSVGIDCFYDSWHILLHFHKQLSILSITVLDGEVAVPYNLQSALARLKSFLRLSVLFGLPFARSVDGWVLRNGHPRTMSGPEGSSIKWFNPCAVG